ncbi:hypothetical protein NQ176_g917 [Zarea fungicola]|uniref:Uncharacterized protein n=1 Tax=Zarea fungicola TaxID=93591 RepID=A0ACC1NVI2_9HYPO|nr:hypothetical protein NQ176_g917 [Lecanicillium fungicola]
MKAFGITMVAANMLAAASGAAVSPVALGNVQFGAAQCGNGNEHNISPDDCAAAVSTILATHCENGLCTLPAADPQSSASGITQTIGACEVFIEVFVGGKPATFQESSVQAAFPKFVSKCTDPSNKHGFGNPILRSTDGRLTLLFSNGVSGGSPGRI